MILCGEPERNDLERNSYRTVAKIRFLKIRVDDGINEDSSLDCQLPIAYCLLPIGMADCPTFMVMVYQVLLNSHLAPPLLAIGAPQLLV